MTGTHARCTHAVTITRATDARWRVRLRGAEVFIMRDEGRDCWVVAEGLLAGMRLGATRKEAVRALSRVVVA